MPIKTATLGNQMTTDTHSTQLKGMLFLGFLPDHNPKDLVDEIDDLISNNEDVSLEELREHYTDVQFSLNKEQIKPQRQIHEILISQILWVCFGDLKNEEAINKKILSIQKWFELFGSKPLNSHQIAFLQKEREFESLVFSIEKPLNPNAYRELELI